MAQKLWPHSPREPRPSQLSVLAFFGSGPGPRCLDKLQLSHAYEGERRNRGKKGQRTQANSLLRKLPQTTHNTFFSPKTSHSYLQGSSGLWAATCSAELLLLWGKVRTDNWGPSCLSHTMCDLNHFMQWLLICKMEQPQTLPSQSYCEQEMIINKEGLA